MPIIYAMQYNNNSMNIKETTNNHTKKTKIGDSLIFYQDESIKNRCCDRKSLGERASRTIVEG